MHQSSGKVRQRKSYDLPMRVRRRQSDARWRANVASCFETLKHVIPVNKRAGKRQISKAFILQETSKHITFLEGTLATLFQEKCKLNGRPEEARERVQEVHSSFIERQREKIAAQHHEKRYKRNRYKFYPPMEITPTKLPNSRTGSAVPMRRNFTVSPEAETQQMLKGKVEELSRTAKGVDLNFPSFLKEELQPYNTPAPPCKEEPVPPPAATPVSQEGRTRRSMVQHGGRRIDLPEPSRNSAGRRASVPFGRIIVIAPRPQGISYKPHGLPMPIVHASTGLDEAGITTPCLSPSHDACASMCPIFPVHDGRPPVKLEITTDTYGGQTIHTCTTPQKRKPHDGSCGSPDRKRLHSPFYRADHTVKQEDVPCLSSPVMTSPVSPPTKFGSPMCTLSLPLNKTDLFPDLLTPTKDADEVGYEYTPIKEKCEETSHGFTPVHLPRTSLKTISLTPPGGFTPPNHSPRTPLGSLSNLSNFSHLTEDGASDTDWDNQSLRCDEDISLSDPEDGTAQKVKNVKPKLKRTKHNYYHYKRKGCHRRRLDSEITVDENHPEDQPAGEQQQRARRSRRSLNLSHIDVAAEKGDDDLWLQTSTLADHSVGDIDPDLGIIGPTMEPMAQPEDFDKYLKMYQEKLGEESALCSSKVEEIPRDIDLIWETLMSDQPDLMNICADMNGPYTSVLESSSMHQHASSQTSTGSASPLMFGYSSASNQSVLSSSLSDDLRDINLQPITVLNSSAVRGSLESVFSCAISPDSFDDLMSCDLNASDETLPSSDDSIVTSVSSLSESHGWAGVRPPAERVTTGVWIARVRKPCNGYSAQQDQSHVWLTSEDTQFVGMDSSDMKLVAQMVDPNFVKRIPEQIKQEPAVL